MQINLRSEQISEFLKKHKIIPPILMILFILISFRIGRSVPNPNPYLLLLFFSIPFVIMVVKSKEIGFYLILIWVFFSDWFFQLNLIPTQLTWMPEVVLIIYALALVYERKKIIKTPIDVPIILFILIAVLSAIMNGKHPITLLFAFRLDLKFILMFYILINFGLEENFYKSMTKTLIALLIIQIPVAGAKYLIYGQGEMAIGTYGAWGGTYSTLLPLIAMSLFGSMYVHEKPRLLYILIIFGFIVFSIIGSKKGLIYYGPVFVLFILWRAIASEKIERKFSKLITLIPLIVVMFMPIIYFVPVLDSYMEDFNRDYRDFVFSYDFKYTEAGDPAGRIPSIIETFKNLSEEPARFLIGYGPGSMIKSYLDEYDTRRSGSQPIWIKYGLTEIVQKPIEYGYLGFILYFLLPIFLLFGMNRKFYNKVDDNYWRTLSFSFAGILFSYFILGICYSALFRSDLAGFIFWFFAAAIYSVGKQKQIL